MKSRFPQSRCIWALLLGMLGSSLEAEADLLVVRSGGFSPGTSILRCDDSSGEVLGQISVETEGFYGVEVAEDQSIYATVNTLGVGEVCRFTPTGTLLARFGANLSVPGNLRFGPDGNIYVLSQTWPETPSRSQVLRYDPTTGEFIDFFVPAGSGGASQVVDLAFSPAGDLYLADLSAGVLRFQGTDGAFLGVLIPAGTAGMTSPSALAFAPDGLLYVACRDSSEILRFDGADGQFTDRLIPAGAGGLNQPTGLAFGPDDELYVSSAGTQSVLVFNARTGAFVRALIDSGTIGGPPTRLVFADALPRLRIEHAGGRKALVSWPARFAHHWLATLSFDEPGPPVALSNVPVLIGDRYFVTNEVSRPSAFFQLVR